MVTSARFAVKNWKGRTMPDWAKILLDLRAIFGSVRQIGRLINHHNMDYLTKMTRGEVIEPRYSTGVALIELYQKHVREEVPIIGAMQQRSLIK